jgi:hypothetical protein
VEGAPVEQVRNRPWTDVQSTQRGGTMRLNSRRKKAFSEASEAGYSNPNCPTRAVQTPSRRPPSAPSPSSFPSFLLPVLCVPSCCAAVCCSVARRSGRQSTQTGHRTAATAAAAAAAGRGTGHKGADTGAEGRDQLHCAPSLSPLPPCRPFCLPVLRLFEFPTAAWGRHRHTGTALVSASPAPPNSSRPRWRWIAARWSLLLRERRFLSGLSRVQPPLSLPLSVFLAARAGRRRAARRHSLPMDGYGARCGRMLDCKPPHSTNCRWHSPVECSASPVHLLPHRGEVIWAPSAGHSRQKGKK